MRKSSNVAHWLELDVAPVVERPIDTDRFVTGVVVAEGGDAPHVEVYLDPAR